MKRVVRLAAIIAVLMMGILISSNTSLAKDGVTTLKKNKVYKAYDVTGDGKADKIKVISKTKKKNDMNTMKIMINGKQAFKLLMDHLDTDVIDIDVLPWNESGFSFWKSLGFTEPCISMRLG